MKNDKHTYIAYKERYVYITSGRVHWVQQLDGPYNSTERDEALSNLREVERSGGDVKDIKTLIQLD